MATQNVPDTEVRELHYDYDAVRIEALLQITEAQSQQIMLLVHRIEGLIVKAETAIENLRKDYDR